MKLKLRAHFSEFTYRAPIVVQKFILHKNRLLSLEIHEFDKAKETFINTLDLVALEHFHHYNIEQWSTFLNSFFDKHDLNFSDIDFKKPFFNTLKRPPVFGGELLFIIESVLFGYIEKKYPEALSRFSRKPIHLNTLYNPHIPLNEFSSWIKIKIRPTKENLISTSSLIKNLLSQNKAILFRLDGNAQFELSELYDFLNTLKNKCGPALTTYIEYIEEPLKNFNDYATYYRSTSYLSLPPIALDESFPFFLENLNQLSPKYFVILKPSLLGISQCFELLEKLGTKIIISSSYETASGIRPLCYLASMNPTRAHGLDTLKFLPERLSIQTNYFSLSF